MARTVNGDTTAAVRPITVRVNDQPVILDKRRLNGLEIKQAAIQQGVAIELSFLLAEIKNGKRRIIGDADPVTVNKNSEFIATANDDNS